MKKTRVLLVEAPYSYGPHGNALVGAYFPLGLGYLAAYLRPYGYEVKIFQPTANDFYDELQRTIDTFRPSLVGISVMTPSYPNAVKLCEIIKNKDGKIRTIMGGHHVSAVKEEVLMQSPHTDFLAVGEGENTLLELLAALGARGSDFSSIPGLSWRDTNGKIVVNPPRGLIQDIDTLPFPARDLVDLDRFRVHSYIDFGKKSATMITSRGCPYKCIFCSSWITMGARYRYRSVGNIMREIRELVEIYHIDHLVFEDDTITLKRDRILELCEALIEMPNAPSWYCLSRVDNLDFPLARKMKAAGCRMVNFGIESGSPEILKKIGKKINLQRAKEAVTACNQAGLRTQCTFIVGFPFDTATTMQMTLEAAIEIGPTIAIFFPLTPYPGTLVFDKYLDPAFVPKSVGEWERFLMTDNESGISLNKQFTGEEVNKIAQRWNRKFYLRPKQWLQMFKTMTSPMDFYRLGMGGMYLLQNYLVNK
jgi:anaerobic magnesium-protoporphyrin IX monomethyl ester cyclase